MPSEMHFFLSSELNLEFHIKISHIEGKWSEIWEESNDEYAKEKRGKRESDLYASCCIFSRGKALTMEGRTTFSVFEEEKGSNSKRIEWNQWMSFPISYKELPLDSMINITIWKNGREKGRRRIPLGGTSFSIFNQNKYLNPLRKGKQNLHLWMGKEADGINHTTPGKSNVKSELDRLEKIVKKYKRGEIAHVEWLDNILFQKIETLRKEHRNNSDQVILCVELPTFEHPIVFNEKENDAPSTIYSNKSIVTHCDPELLRIQESNPIDNKHLQLMIGKKVNDPDLRPSSPAERDRIQKILNCPITRKLEAGDRDFLWKFRFYLTRYKQALTKFLRCVDWSNNQEIKLATELIYQWAPIEISDALELLSKNFTYHVVRDYAVERLEEASNEELLHYLLQLVQALRYDSEEHESKLSGFLIARSIPDLNLRNFLYWYLKVECEDPIYNQFYKRKLDQFVDALKRSDEGYAFAQQLVLMEETLSGLVQVDKEMRMIEPRKEKLQKFKESMETTGSHSNLGKFPNPLPLPLDPEITTTGITPITIFTSSAKPLLLRYKTTTKENGFDVIYKSGDDLRQDQIIIQLISLMDNLLKKESLDLKLTPYKVLATSSREGMVQCVSDSSTIRDLLVAHNGDILEFLKKHNPAPNALAAATNNFVRSCAGYCVVTFILCVGDRHLDNLLITTSGHLFHIDFGFIGRDPKPYPPPM
eukprot:TRINITY_DN1939_c0_g1_i4.p1 TRINITY_DN1939_c0_g1~~TRINITY_DN1939_c0_g1_i4.p1  ORF type:complete len:705 (-),score=270.95 TRINITY_DN1939_c0_g1_i4:499-2613(-)